MIPKALSHTSTLHSKLRGMTTRKTQLLGKCFLTTISKQISSPTEQPSLSQWWTLICGEENSQQSPGLSCWEPWQCRWFHRKARAGRTGPRSTRLGSTDSLWPCVCSHVVPHSRAPSVPPSPVRAAGPVHLPATRGNAKPALQLGGRQHHSGDTSIII